MTLHVVDVTDTLRHILATREIGGIPRLLVTLIENRTAMPDVCFCVYLKSRRQFKLIRNLRSLDVSILDQYIFEKDTDNLDRWIELLKPDLQDLPQGGGDPHYYFLSSQWDTFGEPEDFAFLSHLLSNEKVTCLNHDSYLLDRDGGSPIAQRFVRFWKAVLKSSSRLFYISEHTREHFERHFGQTNGSTVRYDFAFSYPRITGGVSQEAINLSLQGKPYILVFSVLDGRKSSLGIIEALATLKRGNQGNFDIVLIVRFAVDDNASRLKLIDLVLENDLKVFLNPNDLTYLWLIKNAQAIYYPSLKEGFGMVPIDCRVFGKHCFIPEGADFAYLHPNAILYQTDTPDFPSHLVTSCNHVLKPLFLSEFFLHVFENN